MDRGDVVEAVEAKLNELGVRTSSRSVRMVPGQVEVEVLCKSGVKRMRLRTGIPQWELKKRLAELEVWHNDGVGGEQMDLEDLINRGAAKA